MTRKSKREIEQTLADLEGPTNARFEEVGPMEQYLSANYPDPPMEEVGAEWKQQLQPDNEKE